MTSDVLAAVGGTTVAGLIVSAVVNAMPKQPPDSLEEWWLWFHDAAKLFVNYRHPKV